VLTIGLAAVRGTPEVLALPVGPAGPLPLDPPMAGVDPAEITALLEQAGSTGNAGSVQVLPRPLGRPRRLLLVGVGSAEDGPGLETNWRAAGAALAQAAAQDQVLTVAVPGGVDPDAVRGLAEGLLLAAYRFRLGEQ
jgi:leucyl aminopeptidase